MISWEAYFQMVTNGFFFGIDITVAFAIAAFVATIMALIILKVFTKLRADHREKIRENRDRKTLICSVLSMTVSVSSFVAETSVSTIPVSSLHPASAEPFRS